MDAEDDFRCLESMMREWEAEDVDEPRWEKELACHKQLPMEDAHAALLEVMQTEQYMTEDPPLCVDSMDSHAWSPLANLARSPRGDASPAPFAPRPRPPHTPAALLPSVSELTTLCQPRPMQHYYHPMEPSPTSSQRASQQHRTQQQQHQLTETLQQPGSHGAPGVGQYVVGRADRRVVYSPTKADKEREGLGMGMHRTEPVFPADPEMPAVAYINLDITGASAPSCAYLLDTMRDKLQLSALEATYVANLVAGVESATCYNLGGLATYYSTAVFPAEVREELGGGEEGVRIRCLHSSMDGSILYSMLDIFSHMGYTNLNQAVRAMVEGLPSEMKARTISAKWGRQGGHPALFGDLYVVRCIMGVAGLRCKRNLDKRNLLKNQDVVDAVTKAIDNGRLTMT